MRRVTSFLSVMLAFSLGVVATAGCGAAGPHSASQGSPTATVNLTPTVQVIGSAQFPRYVKVDATPDVPGTNETIYEQYWQEQDPAYLKTLVSFLTYTDAYGNEVKGGFMGLFSRCSQPSSTCPGETPTRDVIVADAAFFYGPLLGTQVVDNNLYVEIGVMKSDGTAIYDADGNPLTQTFYAFSLDPSKDKSIADAAVVSSSELLRGGGDTQSLTFTQYAWYLNEFLLGQMVVAESDVNTPPGAPKGYDTSYWDDHRTAAYNAIKGYFLMQQGVKYADLPSQSKQYIGLKPHPGIEPGLFMTGPYVIIFGDLPDPGFPNS